jgi:ParB family chromosome partitioning protein
LRWRAAPLIGWKTLKAVFLSKEEALDEGEVFEGQMVTSIHSQKLHDLDLATALLRLIVHKYPNLKEREAEIPKILNTAFRRLQRESKHLELAQVRLAAIKTQQQWLETAGFKEVEEQEVFATLLGLQLNPITVNNTVFPLLNLAEDLKQIIKVEGLEASKARELNRLSPEQLTLDDTAALQIRSKAAQKTIQEKLSLSEVKVLVNQLIAEHSKKLSTKPSAVAKLTKIIQQTKIEENNQEELKALQNVLEEKLAEIQQFFKN